MTSQPQIISLFNQRQLLLLQCRKADSQRLALLRPLLRRLVSQSSQSLAGQFGRGMAHYLLSQFQEALDTFKDILINFPLLSRRRHAILHYNVARCLFRLNRSCLLEYSQAHTIDTHFDPPTICLIQNSLSLKHIAEAFKLAKSLHSLTAREKCINIIQAELAGQKSSLARSKRTLKTMSSEKKEGWTVRPKAKFRGESQENRQRLSTRIPSRVIKGQTFYTQPNQHQHQHQPTFLQELDSKSKIKESQHSQQLPFELVLEEHDQEPSPSHSFRLSSHSNLLKKTKMQKRYPKEQITNSRHKNFKKVIQSIKSQAYAQINNQQFLQVSERLLQLGEPTKAAKLIKKSLLFNPGFSNYYKLGQLALDFEQSDKAILQFQKALSIEPDNRNVKKKLALANLYTCQQSKIVRAIKLLQSIELDQEVRILLCISYLLMRQPQKAAVLFKQSSHLGPLEKTQLAKVYLSKKNYLMAGILFIEAYRNLGSQILLGEVSKLSISAFPEVFETKVLKALEGHSKIQSILIKATIQAKHKNYQQVISLYKQALALDPNNASILYRLAEFYFTLNQFQKSAVFFKRLLKAEPSVALAWQRLAYIHNLSKQEKKWVTAIELYKKAEECGVRGSDQRRVQVAYCHFKIREFGEALQILKDVEEGQALRLRIACLLSMHQYESALTLLEQLSDDSPSLLFYKALCLYQTNRLQLALQLLSQSLSTEPFAEGLVLKALIMSDLKLLGQGIQLMRKAIERDPDNLQWMMGLSQMLSQAQLRQEQEECLRRCLSRFKDSRVRKLLGKCLLRQGKLSQFQEQYDLLKKENPFIAYQLSLQKSDY